MSIIIANVMRIIGSLFGMISDSNNDIKKMSIYNGISNLFCAVQYFLLGAITGGISRIVSILRNYLFYKYKNQVSTVALILYFTFLILINYTSITSLMTFIPVLLVIVYTIGLYSSNKIVLKYSILITCVLEIIYDMHYQAYAGVFFCALDAILVLISLEKIYKKS